MYLVLRMKQDTGLITSRMLDGICTSMLVR